MTSGRKNVCNLYLCWYASFIKIFRSEANFIIPVYRKSIKLKILEIFNILKLRADTLVIKLREVK